MTLNFVHGRAAWAAMMAGALLLTLLSLRYFALDPEAYCPRQRDVYEDHTAGLLLHIGGMIVPAMLVMFTWS